MELKNIITPSNKVEESIVKGNTFDLTKFRYSNGSRSGVCIHEFAELSLTCKENKLNQLIQFCKDNNITYNIVITERYIQENNETIEKITPYTIVNFEDYMSKINNSKLEK